MKKGEVLQIIDSANMHITVRPIVQMESVEFDTFWRRLKWLFKGKINY